MSRPKKIDVYSTDESVSPVGIRYGTKEMVDVFRESSRLQAMLDVEATVSGVISALYPDKVPKRAADEIRKKASVKYVKMQRVRELEAETHHDVMSVVKALAEQCEGDAGGYVHYSLTSADVTESAKALQLKRGLELLISHIEDLRDICIEKARSWRAIPCIVRTHGAHAVPGVFGLPLAYFAYCLERSADRLFNDYNTCLEGKVSGAVGAFNVLTDEGIDGFEVQKRVFKKLGIKPATVASQVPPREDIGYVLCDVAVLCGTLSNIAEYVRTMRRTEIGELRELGEAGQVGSSTMPHKDVFGGNPFVEERTCSIARVVRGFAAGAVESVEMDYARDLKASLLDRVAIPESFVLADYAIQLTKNMIERVEPVQERIKQNLLLTRGIVTAERVMSKLITKGMNRLEARQKISELAHKASNEGRTFKEVLLQDADICKRLSRGEIEQLANPQTYTGRSADLIDNVMSLYKGKRRIKN